MQIIHSIEVLRELVRDWRRQGKTTAFVPTMGSLHEGHINLISHARALADRVVASVFVNPSQFCAGEDFQAYPRTPEEDAAKLKAAGTDLLFLPAAAEIYPHGLSGLTFVEVPGLSDELCGRFRPGHFRGVTTVVCKLFNLVQPDVAVFGEKDFQQLTLIRRMAADLNLPIRIHGVATVREASGLAMSSRNAYLTADEKRQAALIFRCLDAAREMLLAGSRDFPALETAQSWVLEEAGFRPDYFSIRRLSDLGLPQAGDRSLVILVAAWLGKARLIDNLCCELPGPG